MRSTPEVGYQFNFRGAFLFNPVAINFEILCRFISKYAIFIRIEYHNFDSWFDSTNDVINNWKESFQA